MKVAYLTVGELISLPLLRRQVIELLAAMRGRNPALRITLVSFLAPLTYLRHRRGLVDVRNTLRRSGVDALIIPTPFPWPVPFPLLRKTESGWLPRISWTRWTMRVSLIGVVPILLFLNIAKGIRVFHCRSYPAAYCALALGKLVSNATFIFDPRSDFPEENVTAGVWRRESKDFAFWKELEAVLIRNALATVCIAETYENAFRTIHPAGTFVRIPNNVDTGRFHPDEGARRLIRKRLGISSAEVVLCYLGDLSKNGWHRADVYAMAVLRFRALSNAHRWLFLIPDHAEELLIRQMQLAGVRREEFVICHPGYEEIPLYVAAADYGVMFLHDRKMAVGTKVGEYACSGLPVLVNSNCLGAVELIGAYGLGQIVDIGVGDLDRRATAELDRKITLGKELVRLSNAVAETASDYFANERVAQKYLALYERAAALSN